MPDVITNPEWARVTNTTMHEFAREEEVNILRNRKLTALMKSKGRVTYGHSGDIMDWKVRYKRAVLEGFGDADTLNIARVNRWKTAQLDWRGYASSDAVTKKEKLMNKNTEAIIKLFEGVGKALMEDVDDQFGDQFYIDGNATGNGRKLHGVESFLGTSGAYAGGFIGAPSDSYAGLTTDLGTYGGSWSGTTWPIGTGDAHYDFWSPLIVDYTDTLWAASTKTWVNTCVEALRFGILHSQRNKSRKGMLDMVLLERELFRGFLEKQETKERIIVKSGGLYELGFTDVQNFDGVEVTTEYGIPSTVGYGFNTEQMELASLQDQLFVAEGPEYSVEKHAWIQSVDFYGNLKCNPRFFVKWDNVT